MDIVAKISLKPEENENESSAKSLTFEIRQKKSTLVTYS